MKPSGKYNSPEEPIFTPSIKEKIMKKNLILCVLLLAGCAITMQAREIKTDILPVKPEGSKQDTAHAAALNALIQGHFVLQADEVISKNGEKAKVDSVANFVAMKGSAGVVQIANLVEGAHCGITMEGRIGQLNITEDRRKNTICTFNIDSPTRTLTVKITLPKKGNKAFAEISSCKHVKGIAFSGRLLYGTDATILIGNPS